MNRFDIVYLSIVGVACAAMLGEMFTTFRRPAKPKPAITMERDVYGDARQVDAPEPPLPPLHEYPFRVAPYYPLDPDPTEQIELDSTKPIDVAAMLGTTYESERAQLP
jgi:hypothetical protein